MPRIFEGMMMMMKSVMPVLLLLMVLLSWRVSAYPSGAPSSSCQSMLPGHKSGGTPILAQNANDGSAPFTVAMSQLSYRPGDKVKVTVTGVNGQVFRGFIIQARRADSSLNTVEPIGTFTVFSGTQASCNQPTGAYGLTHTTEGSNMLKTSQVYEWTAPGAAQGHVIFRMTLAETKYKFWTDVESPVLKDESAPELTTESNNIMKPIRQINTVNECGSVKGCYLSPGGCVESECEFLLTYRGNGDFVDFEMGAKTNGYVAVGFSYDSRMGRDSVIECVYDKDKNTVIVRHSYNDGPGSNIAVSNPSVGLYNMTGYYNNGRLSCRFRRRRIVDGVIHVFNLDENYYLLMARGAVQKGIKYQHDLSTGSMVSPEKVDTASIRAYSGTKRYPIAKAHGCLMTLAWVFCISFSLLVARYYKTMWPSQRLGDERIWFQVHRGLNISAVIITILSVVLIFIMVGGYSYGLRELPYSAHPILGLIVTCLAIINPLISLCRPHPGDEYRPIFNWVHWAIGTIAHVLSVPTMFIGLSLPKAHAPPAASWVLIVYVIVHCVIELVLEIHQCCTHRRNKEKKEEYEMYRSNHPKEYTSEPEPSGRFFKMFMLAAHGVLVGCCTLAIILMIAIW